MANSFHQSNFLVAYLRRTLLFLGLAVTTSVLSCAYAQEEERLAPRAQASRPGDLSPYEFFRKPAYRHISMSPNGRYLAVVEDAPFDEAHRKAMERRDELEDSRSVTFSFAGETYGDQLLIYDLEARLIVRVIPFFQQKIYWTHWTSEDRVLVSLSTTYDIKYGRKITFQLPASRTLSVNWVEPDVVELFGEDRSIQRQNLFLSSFVDPLANDPDHILMSAYKNGDLDLWRVNVITGVSGRVSTGSRSTFAWIADRNGEPVMRLDRNRSRSVMKVFTKDRSGRWRKAATTRLNTKGETPFFQPVAKGDKPNEIYVIATPEGESAAAIWAYDASTNMFTHKVAEAGPYDIASSITDPNTNEYLGALYYEDTLHTIMKDAELDRHVKAVNVYFGGDSNVVLVAASKKYSKLVFNVTSPVNSGEVYVYDYQKRHLDHLFILYPNLPESLLAPVETVQYETRDGLTLTGYLTHPRSVGNTGAAPLVIMPHGGPAVRDVYGFDPMAQFIASRGYRVFQPNFRGSFGYGLDFMKAGYGEWGGKMHTDLMDGLAHLTEQGWASPGRSCIVGWSYGGYAALYATMADPSAFACAVSIAGVSDLPDLLKAERKDSFVSAESLALLYEQIGHPKTDKAQLVALSPGRQVERLTTPMLIMHGKHDAVVPYAQSYDLMMALDDAEIEYKWRVFSDDHSLSDIGSRVQAMKEIDRFLRRHLK